MTAHFVSDDWKLQTRCLTTMYSPDSHTAEHIAQFTRNGLKDYDLYLDRVMSITTDSAANMIAACKVLKVLRISCFGHILHNAITVTLDRHEEIPQLLKACRRIVSIFSFSFKHRRNLAKVQKEMQLKQCHLVNDVSTRWGSKLKMLQRLHEQMDAVDKLFHDDRKYREYMLSFSQRDLLQSVVKALELYEKLTDMLSGETMPTSSSVPHILCHLAFLADESRVQDDLTSSMEEQTVCQLRNSIWDYVNERFRDEEVNKELAAAILLDRRFEYDPPSGFWPTHDEAKSHLIKLTEQCVREVAGPISSSTVTVAEKPKSCLVACLLTKRSIAGATSSITTPQLTCEERAKREVDFFLSLTVDPTIDILQWWRRNEKELPHLRSLAKKYLAVCATSVSSERLFSIAGHIVSKKRTALKPHLVDKLVFLALNNKSVL